MRLFVNGERFDHGGKPCLDDVLRAYGVAEGARVAVVLGEAVIPQEERSSCPVKENDRIEILVFAGGG
jgi:thiamine biosynthesis protein ThiS